MDMGTSDMMGVGDSGPLTSAGFNMSNATDAANFLDAILDDSDFMPLNKDIVKAFWYGMVVIIGIAGFYNAYTLIVTMARSVDELYSGWKTLLSASLDYELRQRTSYIQRGPQIY